MNVALVWANIVLTCYQTQLAFTGFAAALVGVVKRQPITGPVYSWRLSCGKPKLLRHFQKWTLEAVYLGRSAVHYKITFHETPPGEYDTELLGSQPSCRLFGLLTWLIFFVFVAFKIAFAHQIDTSWNERLTFSRVLYDVAIKWTVCGCIILEFASRRALPEPCLYERLLVGSEKGNFADQGSLFEEPFAEAGLAHARFCKMLSHTF